MNNTVFKQGYADQYDLFYGDKDYESECDLLEKAFKRYSKEPVQSILDLGCGTGNHSIPLARCGYEVHGVDLSENMLAHAVEKTQKEIIKYPPVFSQGDIRSVDLGKQFDAALMMFAVLGYQLTNDDVLAALRTVRKHLKPGGLFIFDVWYGPAVLAIRPSDRVKIIPTADGKVIRAASGRLDVSRHLAEVHYHIWHLTGDRVISEAEESHTMRFFFSMELAMLLFTCGLMIESLTAFPSLEQPADETTWNVLAMAKVQ
ncbi:MAG: class I SAM-dependent methyltransferase [Anaerolineales bacterium]|nr:class I SAM-dependent methyltransferase [Anaerolineales bacterium]